MMFKTVRAKLLTATSALQAAAIIEGQTFTMYEFILLRKIVRTKWSSLELQYTIN